MKYVRAILTCQKQESEIKAVCIGSEVLIFFKFVDLISNFQIFPTPIWIVKFIYAYVKVDIN